MPSHPITATHINLYHVCHRQLWLHVHGIRMEHQSDAVYAGKLVGETAYGQRARRYRELEIAGSKIDHFDPREQLVREVKKSSRKLEAHRAQVLYYCYLLRQNGIEANGLLEYPSERRTVAVEWTEDSEAEVESWLTGIRQVIESATCPEVIRARYCRQCSYYEFCYVENDL